jgi:hypothetical protein
MKRLQRLTYIPLYHHHFIVFVFVFVFEFVSFHGQKEGKERKGKERQGKADYFFLLTRWWTLLCCWARDPGVSVER